MRFVLGSIFSILGVMQLFIIFYVIRSIFELSEDIAKRKIKDRPSRFSIEELIKLRAELQLCNTYLIFSIVPMGMLIYGLFGDDSLAIALAITLFIIISLVSFVHMRIIAACKKRNEGTH